MSPKPQILTLLPWRGTWAIRAVFDDAIRRYLQNQPYDPALIQTVVSQSAGASCQRYAQKLHQLTGAAFSFNNDTKKEFTRPIINLAALAEGYQPLTKAQVWRERLEKHYDASGTDLYPAIMKARANELTLIQDQSIEWIAWSFEVLSKLLAFSGNLDRIHYQPDAMAELCWKRWYLADDGKTVLWTDTGISPETPASKILVYRLIHEATHLMHLSAFPSAGSLTSPEWLLTMESVAMAAEFLFLEYLQQHPNLAFPFEARLYYIVGTLLVGLYERALRIDFDVMVHVHGMSASDWVAWAVAQTNFSVGFFDFAYEFNGVHGFAAGYTLGMECFLAAGASERQELISGKKAIDQLINKRIEHEKIYQSI